MRTRKNEYSENNIIENIAEKISDNKIKIFSYSVAEQVYIFLKFSFEYCIKFITIFINISGIYIVWILLHYIASQLYVKMCVPSTLVGFLLSPFMTATPHCQGLRWIVYNAANIINNMWIIFGAWIMSNVLVVIRDTNTA